MYRTNIYILVAKCLISPCTVCFLLCSTFHVLHLMECTVLVIVVLLLLLLSSFLCVVVVCFAPWFPLDCFRSYLSHRIVACFSLCTRNSFFISTPTPSSLNLSLLFYRDGSHPKLFLTPSSSGDSCVLLSRIV